MIKHFPLAPPFLRGAGGDRAKRTLSLFGAREVEDVVRLYGKLSRTVALFGRVRVLDFDEKAGETFQRLLTENPTLAKQRLQKDMRIAAIALAFDAVVVTRNYRDFSQVSGLNIEDWSQPDG